jgi:hypothetical protein
MSRTSIPPLPKIPGVRVKHIDGWPGYAVSDDGRVWTCNISGPNAHTKFNETWKQLIPGRRGRRSYFGVTLCNHGVMRQFLVHHLVLNTFIGPCPEGMECCHWDDDASHNHLFNLRWDTNHENRMDMIRNGRSTRGIRNPMAILTPSIVRDIRSLAGLMTHKQIGRKFGIARETAGEIIRGDRWGWLH